MAKITAAGNADRAFLSTMPQFSLGSKPVAEWSDDYAHRQAQAARLDLERGDVPSIKSGRAHVLTPEHPNRQIRATLEGSKRFASAAARSKYTERLGKDTGGAGETPPAPSQRRTAALTGEPQRPLIHRRPPFQGHIPFGEGGEIYTQRSADEAARVIRYAAELGPTHGERIVLQVYDCSKGRYFPVFRNAGHGQGINASVLLEMWRDHGGSLEAFLMALINDASYRDRSRISHICLYEVTILPRDLPAVTALKQRLANGR